MKLKLLDELDAGINTLETNFSSSSDTINAKLNDCLSDDKSQFLSSNARQTLLLKVKNTILTKLNTK